MATFNYIKAVWRNGPGVVSDAPDWALGAVERALAGWLEACGRALVGVHVDRESGLALRIFVSPSAAGSAALLEDAPDGSFVHVVASDRSNAGEGPDEAGRLFASVYGSSLSDAALRQQRAFMLLDFPYHQALATDLFVDKDLLEERTLPPAVEPAASAPSSAPDGLPFDQGLSYQEVVSRLADAALRQARYDPGSIPKLVPAAGRGRSPDVDVRETFEPAEVAPPARGPDESGVLPLSSLLGDGSAARRAERSSRDGLPFDQGLSYQEVLDRVGRAVQGVAVPERGRDTVGPTAVEARSATELEAAKGAAKGAAKDTKEERADALPATPSAQAAGAAAAVRSAAPVPVAPPRAMPRVRRRRDSSPESWSPVLAAAGFLLLVLVVLGVMVLRSPPDPTAVAVDEPSAAAPEEPVAMQPAAPEVAPTPGAPEVRRVKPVPALPAVEAGPPPARRAAAESVRRAENTPRSAPAPRVADPVTSAATAATPRASAPRPAPVSADVAPDASVGSPPAEVAGEAPVTPVTGPETPASLPPVSAAVPEEPAREAGEGVGSAVTAAVEAAPEHAAQVLEPVSSPRSTVSPTSPSSPRAEETEATGDAGGVDPDEVDALEPEVERRRLERRRLLKQIQRYR